MPSAAAGFASSFTSSFAASVDSATVLFSLLSAGFELEEQAAKKLLASMILAILNDKNFLIKLCMYINILSLLLLFAKCTSIIPNFK